MIMLISRDLLWYLEISNVLEKLSIFQCFQTCVHIYLYDPHIEYISFQVSQRLRLVFTSSLNVSMILSNILDRFLSNVSPVCIMIL